MRLLISNFSTLHYSILMMLSLIFFACGEPQSDVDTSGIQLNLKVKHFEQQLFSYENITDAEVNQLKNEYGIFFTHFVENIITISEVNDPSVYYYLNAFKNDSYIKEVQKKVNETYQDFSPYQDQLTESFKLYKHYFPSKHVPEIITYTSGFNYAIAADSVYLGIGLDMFLGADYKPYIQLGLPQYKIANMTKNHLVTSAVMSWIATEFELLQTDATLLSEMVHQGKLLYVLNLLTPFESEHLKMGYTEEQLEWCEKNEKEIWFYLVDNELFFTKETKEIIKYMGEAPFVQGFPEGSPGKVGHWVGWQIVKKYMENNPKLTLQDLMNENDEQKILNLSKYKP